MLKDPTEFRERFARWKNGKQVYKNGVPYDDDNHNLEYDHARATQLGYTPDKTGHYSTRDYETGRYLKSPAHPTIMKSIVSDLGVGYNPYYDKRDGQMYSDTWMKPLKDEVNTPYLPKFGGGKRTTYENIIDSIIREEGFISTPRNIGDGVMTLGSGLTNKRWHDLYKKKGVWTEKDNRMAVTREVSDIRKYLSSNIPYWSELPIQMQDTLIDIQYNTGALTKKKSPNFMRMLANKEYEKALGEMNWGRKQYTQFPGLRDRNVRRQEKWSQGLAAMGFGPTNPKKLQRVIESAPKYIPPKIMQAEPDYSLTNPAPPMISSWNNPTSPSNVKIIPRITSMSQQDDSYLPNIMEVFKQYYGQ